MKALILVGGYGTRMRPLTVTCPKSVLPFINKPMVEFQVQALAKVGVTEIILAINYQGQIIQADLKELSEKYNVKIIYVRQQSAMGTAGPIKLAEQILRKDNASGKFFVFNSDIICDFPLQQLIEAHQKYNKQATIVLATVEDPSRFGVIVTNSENRIDRFVEKPKEFISNKINAGIYLLNLSVIDLIPLRFCMIQKQIFPKLAEEGHLFGLPLQNDFWFDLGKPSDYIKGQGAYLNYHKDNKDLQIKDTCLIDKTAKIGPNCQIGPNVVIGPNCEIGAGCLLKNCAIFKNSKVGTGCFIEGSIVSWSCMLGNWVRIEGLSAIAEDVKIKEETRLTRCMVLSHKNVVQNSEDQILM